jgi:2Fe-2S ferredoxin
MLKVIFIDADGTRHEVDAAAGESLLTIAHRNRIDVEGACEGSMACSTCHLVVAPEWYGKLPPAIDEESDLLDLAAGLTRTSRLGCQIVMSEALDGLVVSLPGAVHNLVMVP